MACTATEVPTKCLQSAFVPLNARPLAMALLLPHGDPSYIPLAFVNSSALQDPQLTTDSGQSTISEPAPAVRRVHKRRNNPGRVPQDLPPAHSTTSTVTYSVPSMDAFTFSMRATPSTVAGASAMTTQAAPMAALTSRLPPDGTNTDGPERPGSSSPPLGSERNNNTSEDIPFPLAYSYPTQEACERFNAVYRAERTHFLSQTLLSDLREELYGKRHGYDQSLLLDVGGLDADLFMGTFVEDRYISPYAYSGYLRCLHQFLTDGDGAKRVDGLIQRLQTNLDSNWINDTHAHQVKRACCILLYALGFHYEIEMRDFKRDLARMFPGYPWVESQSPLSVCLGDIQDAALVIEPTDDPSEHLTVQNDTVKILRVTPSNIVFLESYNSNRVAIALGLQTLGSEIFESLQVLYGKDRKFSEAIDLKVLEGSPELQRRLSVTLLLGSKPKVLSGRVRTLEKLVRYRKSWWPSLLRDMRASRQEKPVFFWGTILATGFGFCQLLQTIATIWALVIAIKLQGGQT